MPFGFLPLLILLAVGVVYFQRHPDALSRARFIRRTAFGVMAFATLFIAAFAGGEAVTDPGGLAAVGLIAAWLVPLVAVSLLAWYRPAIALPVLVALVVGVLGMSVWAATQSESWRTFEDDHGPVRTLVVFALSAAVAVFGLRRTRTAGLLLVTLGVLPLLLSSLGSDLALGSLFAAVTPAAMCGVLYLISARLDPGSAPGPTSPPQRFTRRHHRGKGFGAGHPSAA